jgi:hypothetical protein
MDKLARRKHFDRLVELRELYKMRGPDDSTSVVSVEVMLSRAQALFERPAQPILMLDESGQKN